MDLGKIALALAMERPKGLVSVASRGKWYDKASNGTTDKDLTYRSVHEVLCDCTGIVVMYGNFFNDGRTTGLTPVTLKITIDSGGITYPFQWDNGNMGKVLHPGARALSDVLRISLKKGDRVHIRTHGKVEDGGKYPLGLTVVGGSNPGEGVMEGDATTGTFTSNTPNAVFAYTPLAIYGTSSPSAGRFKTVGISGDSISVGAGRSIGSVDGRPAGEVGFLQIGAMRAGWGYVSVGMNGQKASNFGPANRINQLEMVKDCDLVIVEYGTNDFSSTGITYEKVKADLLGVHRAYWDMGIQTVQTTIAPRTNSTDNWATLENQTPAYEATSGSPGSIRSRINDWIRNNTDNIRHIEIADVWESARNSGLWKVNPSLTSDGIHPNNQGHDNAAANAVRDYLLALN